MYSSEAIFFNMRLTLFYYHPKYLSAYVNMLGRLDYVNKLIENSLFYKTPLNIIITTIVNG